MLLGISSSIITFYFDFIRCNVGIQLISFSNFHFDHPFGIRPLITAISSDILICSLNFNWIW